MASSRDTAQTAPTDSRFLSVLGAVIKAAGLVVTAPATWVVARDTFGDMTAPAVIVVQVAALVLVEGVFLAGWVALEHDNDTPEALRLAYAVLVVVMYAVLLGVGVAHGEGMAGALFRVALGLAVGLSVYRVGVLTWRRRKESEARGVRHTRRFRRYRRRLELDAEMERLRLDVEWQRAEHTRVHTDRMRLLEPPPPQAPSSTLAKRKNGHSKDSSQPAGDRRSQAEALLRVRPEAPAEELAREAGVSLRTAYRWKARIKP